MRETLRPLSHRVDAWVTSLVTRRLGTLRSASPTGVRTGAYGWLTDVEATDPNPSREGYVVTPSLQHATTAAVLRSGWQPTPTRRPSPSTSSPPGCVARRRWSTGCARADGRGAARLPARAGSPRQRSRPAHRGLPRDLPARPPGHSGRPRRGHGAVSHRRPERGRRPGAPPGQRTALGDDAGPRPRSRTRRARPWARRSRRTPHRRELEETFDAVGDLLLAESVHQLVGGSALRAGLAADAVGRAQDLPSDFEVLRTPRSGLAVTHHVGILLAR